MIDFFSGTARGRTSTSGGTGTNFTVPNNISSMKCSLNLVPGLADVGVPHGVEDGPRSLAPGSGSKIPAYHVDQRKKLKEWNG